MPQRYKLRLGDGTLLSVDSDALRNWESDAGAMAQLVGSWRWQPLRDVLAEEDAAARLAQALTPPPAKPDVASRAATSVQPLADDPASSHLDPEPFAAMPVIPLKPLGDDSGAARSDDLWGEEEEAEPEGRRGGDLEGLLATALGGVKSLLDRGRESLGPRLRDARQRVSAWWAERRRVAAPPPAAAGPDEAPEAAPPPEAALPPKALDPFPPEPVQAPPPPVADLPVVPFAPSRERREPEDVYEDEGPPFSLAPIWSWAKRVVAVGALGALCGYAFLERHVWVPKALDLGQSAFERVHGFFVSRQRGEDERRALAEAAERLPALAPETIRLVYSRSPGGVPEAGEVFQLAREAADRGRARLTPDEAAELQALERDLLKGLSAAQRGRIRDYDRTRARRVVFPFENPPAMDLVARGAGTLAPERLERLRALTHRAVAAGIDAPAPPSPVPAARPKTAR